jgi:hypothetical protein
MSYRKYLSTSQVQAMALASPSWGEAERAIQPALAWPGTDEAGLPGTVANRPGDYTLPTGIASLEHWLDLNA